MTGLVFALFVVQRFIALGLRLLNLRHLAAHGGRVPPELEGEVEGGTLDRITAYTRDRARVGLVSMLLGSVLTAFVLFGGLLGHYDRLIASVTDSYVGAGVLFFLGLSLASTLVSLPVEGYLHFRVEARHGFNRMTPGLWLSDTAKGSGISAVITSLCVSIALLLLRAAPELWWLYVWAFLCGLSLLLMYVSPYLIEPLFFKMKPLEVEGLEQRVRELAERSGVRVERVLEVDASRRSNHSNAYFTGVGRVKRVVLFDTLLERMSHAEILGVLAHELGHWKRHHVFSRLVVGQAVAFVALLLASRLLHSEALPALFGLEQASLYARAVLLAFLGALASFPLTPLSSYWSRRHEWQADAFAAELTHHPEALASALVKLSRDNLANLHPHPLFAAFYYSHPPAVERVRRLRASRA